VLSGRAGFVLQIFFHKNNFEADFSGVEFYGVFTSRSDFKPLSDFREVNRKPLGNKKPILAYNFSLGPKGV
jgi:hypothetical protein